MGQRGGYKGRGSGFNRQGARFKERPAVTAHKVRAYLDMTIPDEGPGRERFERDFAPERMPALPKTRGPVNYAESEGPVINAVSDLLAKHPRVLFAVRQNSGAAQADKRFVRFYLFLRYPEPFALPDFWGMLENGRMFFLEAKRPSWRTPHDDRERKQESFLNHARQHGAIAAFVRSAEEAFDALSALA